MVERWSVWEAGGREQSLMEGHDGVPAFDIHSERVGELSIRGEAGAECLEILRVERRNESVNERLQRSPVCIGSGGLGVGVSQKR